MASIVAERNFWESREGRNYMFTGYIPLENLTKIGAGAHPQNPKIKIYPLGRRLQEADYNQYLLRTGPMLCRRKIDQNEHCWKMIPYEESRKAAEEVSRMFLKKFTDFNENLSLLVEGLDQEQDCIINDDKWCTLVEFNNYLDTLNKKQSSVVAEFFDHSHAGVSIYGSSPRGIRRSKTSKEINSPTDTRKSRSFETFVNIFRKSSSN